MTANSPDPYTPPTSDLEGPSPPATSASALARVAGGFLAVNAAFVAVFWLRRTWEQATVQEAPTIMLAPTLGPAIFVLLTDSLLAIPLLRGSTRFRVVTWIRGVMSIVGPVALTGLSYMSLKKFSPDRAEEILDRLDFIVLRGALFAVALLLLVTTQPQRWRLIVGLACIAGYVWLTLAPPW